MSEPRRQHSTSDIKNQVVVPERLERSSTVSRTVVLPLNYGTVEVQVRIGLTYSVLQTDEKGKKAPSHSPFFAEESDSLRNRADGG